MRTAKQHWPRSRWNALRCHLTPQGPLRNENGSATLELAFLMAFFACPLLLGTGQVGILVYDSIEVTSAANEGADYGMQSLTAASDTSGIATAAQQEATDFGNALVVTSSTYYACAAAITGTQYTGSNAQANATAACTGTNNHPLQFVKVTTSVPVSPLIRCPGLPTSYTLTGSSVMEVEQ